MARLSQLFAPREREFFDLFEEAGANIVRAADLLERMLEQWPDHGELSRDVVVCEQEGDRITHDIIQRLNQTFVTPFDREDIYSLGSQLDDVMDHLEAVGNLLYLYGLTELPSLPREMHDLVNVLDQQAKLTAAVMPRFRTMKNLKDYWVECNRLENEGDKAYRMLLVRLFSGEYDALTVLKMKEVADELEAACDAFEHVANTVETISVKES